MGYQRRAGLVSSEVIEEAVAWRRDLHQHPELAFKETRTADFIARQLTRFGFTVHRGLAGSGVVGTLSRGASVRTIAIRADMDGLPIQEKGAVEYVSRTAGVMHACGHDGHVTMALAAARLSAELLDLDGTVHFIFQPAEENEGGAKRMMDEGLFRQFPCDAVYALHNWPALPLGTCVALNGAMMAALASFEIVVEGRGCHGAMPHEGADPILTAAHLICALQSVASRNVDALDSSVISATQVSAGSTWNVIPDRCVIRGTGRWFDEDVGSLMESRVRQLSHMIANGFECRASVHYDRRFPPTINHPLHAGLLREVASGRMVGLQVCESRPSMSSEDFAFMLREVPGCYLWLGAKSGDRGHGLHSPEYDFNDELIPHGVALWVALVQRTIGVVDI